jgi:hypothetical protein
MKKLLYSLSIALAACFILSGCVSGRKFREMFHSPHHGTYQPILTIDFDKGKFFVMRTEFASNNLNLNTLAPCKKVDFIQQEKWLFLENFQDTTHSGVLVFASNFRQENSDKLRDRYSLFDTLLINYANDIFIGKWKKITSNECPNLSGGKSTVLELKIPGLQGTITVVAELNNEYKCTGDNSYTGSSLKFVCTNNPKPRKNESGDSLLSIDRFLNYGSNGFTYFEANLAANNYKRKIGIYDANNQFLKLMEFKIYQYNPRKPDYDLAGVFENSMNQIIYKGWWKKVCWYRDGKLLLLN